MNDTTIRRVTLLAVAVVIGLAAGLPRAFARAAEPAAAAAKPLPLEVAYAQVQLPRHVRFVLSPDGRYVAFEVQAPKTKVPGEDAGAEARFLPSGAPSSAEGMRLQVAEVNGGATRRVCGESANCWRGSFSPDSRLLAFYSDQDGEVGVWVYDLQSGASRRVGKVRIKAKLWPGDEAAWSRDGKEVFVPVAPEVPGAAAATPGDAEKAPAGAGPTVQVFRTKVEGGGAPTDPTAAAQEHFTRENNATLAAVELATGNVRVIVDAGASPRPACLRLSPDQRWVSYLSVFRLPDQTSSETLYDLAIVPAAGGSPIPVATGIQVPEGDYFGAIYRWTPDSRRIAFLKDKRLWISEISAKGAGQPRRLGEQLGDLQEEPLLLTADGSGVLVGLAPVGEMTYYFVPARALALVPLDGREPRTLELSGRPLPADQSTLWQPEPGMFYLVVDERGAGRRSILRVDTVTGATRAAWTGQGRINVVGALPDDTGVVARFEGLATAPDLYRFSRDFAKTTRISHVEPRLDGVTVGPMEAFETVIPGHDGSLRTVETNIFLPAGAKRGDKLPGLVYFYAGLPFSLYAQDYGGGAPNSIPVQVFATRGYAVLFCDVPLGPQGKGGNPMQEMADTVLAQVYRAADLGYIDVRRVAIMGQSYGGYGTAAVITQTNLFRAAMALDGVYDLGGEFARMDSGGGSFNFVWSETGQGRMGTHPWADFKRYIDNSPYYQADKINTPLLLIHGKADQTCPVEQAQKLYNALKRLDKDCELAVYAGEGHVPGEWALPNAVDATERMLDYLARHLKQ
jgi:dipeptidyl aminopeptidase/acylaminoacyl peptidase